MALHLPRLYDKLTMLRQYGRRIPVCRPEENGKFRRWSSVGRRKRRTCGMSPDGPMNGHPLRTSITKEKK